PPGCDDHAADGYTLRTSLDQLLPELVRWTFGKRAFFACRRTVEQSPILRHDSIEQIKPRKYFDEIIEFTARNQNEFAAGFPHIFQRLDRCRADFSIPGNGAVVVGCQSVISHNFRLIREQEFLSTYLRGR